MPDGGAEAADVVVMPYATKIRQLWRPFILSCCALLRGAHHHPLDCTWSQNFLGLPIPISEKDKKPIEILKAVTGGQIAADKLKALRAEFCRALAI